MFQFLLVEMIEEQKNGAIIYGFILQPPKTRKNAKNLMGSKTKKGGQC
jgi:hypothetical protein